MRRFEAELRVSVWLMQILEVEDLFLGTVVSLRI